MIKIDLSLAHSHKRMNNFHLSLILAAVLIIVVIFSALALTFQFKSLSNIATQVERLDAEVDSLRLIEAETERYFELTKRYNELASAFKVVATDEEFSDEMKLLLVSLEPGMRLTSFQINSDSVVALCLSPSNLKIQRYVEKVTGAGRFSSFRSEPQGRVKGLIEHKLVLNKK